MLSDDALAKHDIEIGKYLEVEINGTFVKGKVVNTNKIRNMELLDLNVNNKIIPLLWDKTRKKWVQVGVQLF